MKVLPKPLKVIFAILLCIITLTTGIFAALGMVVLGENYYYVPEQSLYDNALQNRLFTITVHLAQDILYLENNGEEAKITEYAKRYCEKHHINAAVSVDDVIIFDNTTDQTTLATAQYISQFHHPDRAFHLSTKLYNITPGSSFAYLHDGAVLLYKMRYAVWVLTGIGALLMLGLSALLILSAGKSAKTGEVVCSSLLYKMPFSIVVCLFIAAGCSIIGLFAELDNELYEYTEVWHYCLPIIFSLCFLLLVWLCALLVTKIRSKTLLNTLITYRVCRFLYRKVCKPLYKQVSYLWKNLSLWWKGGLFLGAVTLIGGFLVFFLCLFSYHGAEMMVVLLVLALIFFAILLLGCGILTLIQLQNLKAGALRIKEGGLHEKIDTTRMFWEFKSHADTLNSIGDGIRLAVNEKLKSERFQTELLTNVSHDIKTPMTSIINYIDLLDKLDLPDETAKEYISVLTRQSAKLKKLTEDLVEASKAQSGALTPVIEPLDLTMAVSQALGEYTDRMEEVMLTPVVRVPKQAVTVLADGKMLWRVLDNLLSNVVKYAMPQTRVFVELKENAVLSIKNISKEQLSMSGEELVGRFVRGDASRTGISGSGLGLSIASGLSKLMEGELSVTVDGDLFKAELSLPMAGAAKLPEENQEAMEPVTQA